MYYEQNSRNVLWKKNGYGSRILPRIWRCGQTYWRGEKDGRRLCGWRLPPLRLRCWGNCSDGGNNYEACIVTAENALKDYPYTKRREDFALLIMKSKYELAQQSVESKKMERFQDAEDEAYGFVNEYPDSKERKLAEEYIAKCKKITSTAKDWSPVELGNE